MLILTFAPKTCYKNITHVRGKESLFHFPPIAYPEGGIIVYLSEGPQEFKATTYL